MASVGVHVTKFDQQVQGVAKVKFGHLRELGAVAVVKRHRQRPLDGVAHALHDLGRGPTRIRDLIVQRQEPQEEAAGGGEVPPQAGHGCHDEPVHLVQGDLEKDHVTKHVEATPPRPPAHLLVLHRVERDRVARKDDGAARHVDAVGQRLSRHYNSQVATAEKHLDGHLVLVLQPIVVHADAVTQDLDQGMRLPERLAGAFSDAFEILCAAPALLHEGELRPEGRLVDG
mmetsp:Transcript_10908/g.26720  ORF Transcript_10908/g.26720 Transcript_10908/m.26720 type:complete len:229 (-) Transcript_10908:358-1044(-)